MARNLFWSRHPKCMPAGLGAAISLGKIKGPYCAGDRQTGGSFTGFALSLHGRYPSLEGGLGGFPINGSPDTMIHAVSRSFRLWRGRFPNRAAGCDYEKAGERNGRMEDTLQTMNGHRSDQRIRQFPANAIPKETDLIWRFITG